MECVEGALKTSFQKEVSMKSSPQVVFDDLWGVDVENVTTCDDFFVDELLNFSNEDGLVEEEEEPEGDKGFGSVSPKKQTLNFDISDSSSNFSLRDDFGSVPTSELNLPEEDMADLEWLSQFVDDSENSFSEYSTPYATVILPSKAKKETKTAPEAEPPALKTPVQGKIRSKRIRTGGRLWSLGSTPLPVSSSSSSSSTSSSSFSPPSGPWFFDTTTQDYQPAEAEKEKPLTKKLKKKSGSVSSGSVQPPRRCSHCGVHKTPQWRAGPLGAKTLCNACGVRYKSGRLLPEYRPACSPTFSCELHSNHHRRVLEMRSKKEVVAGIPDSGLTPSVVHSFDPDPNRN